MELAKIIEAVLFVSEQPVTIPELCSHLNPDLYPELQITPDKVAIAIQEIQQRYEETKAAIEIREIAGGYQIMTRIEMAPYLRHLIVLREQKKLSRAAMETLSIIAYRQPITRAEIDYIRGVNSDYAIQKLLEKQLIEPSGRSDAPGRPLLYKTSQLFMEYFGLRSPADLPKLQEIPHEEENLQLYQNPELFPKDETKTVPKNGKSKQELPKAEKENH
ncbi:MAG: SMC-Scp complex subunit ScpB [Bacteroidia bacterium]|nr:SMC-Scp complex subunit ScpB [Bacteroidia bacterium]